MAEPSNETRAPVAITRIDVPFWDIFVTLLKVTFASMIIGAVLALLSLMFVSWPRF